MFYNIFNIVTQTISFYISVARYCKMLFAVRHRELPSKDVVTCAVTHQDINGMSAVSTVAVKTEGDGVQMSALSGYETYV